jgi:signal peptidase
MIKTKKVGRVLYWFLIAFLALVAGVVAVSILDIPGGIKLFTVQSGSMSPKIRAGSIVVVKPADHYRTGDVITFRSEPEREVKIPKLTITHRIDEVKLKDEGLFYQTKGDANPDPDVDLVAADLVLGRVIFSLPLIGYPVSFAKTQVGLIVLIIVPATVIIYSELLTIKNEAKKLIKERKRRKLSSLEKAEVTIGEGMVSVEEGLEKVGEEIKEKMSNEE